MTIQEFFKVFKPGFDTQIVITDGWLDEEIVYRGSYLDIPYKVRKKNIGSCFRRHDGYYIMTTRYLLETREYWYMPDSTINMLRSGELKPFSKNPIR